MQGEFGPLEIIGGKHQSVILQAQAAGAFAALGDKTHKDISG